MASFDTTSKKQNDLVLIHTDGNRNPISEIPVLMTTITKLYT